MLGLKIVRYLLILLFLASCSTHKAVLPAYLANDLDAQQNKMSNNGIDLIVKPIHLKSEHEDYFDVDLLQYGVLPVQISIYNNSDESLQFSRKGINMIRPAQTQCPLLPVDNVMEKVKKSYWRTAGWGAAFGLFGAIPSAINVSDTNRIIQTDYDTKVFKSGNLPKGATTEGFVFFEVPDSLTSLDGWILKFSYKVVSSPDLLTLEYGLAGTVKKREPLSASEDNNTSDNLQ